jgi:ABC-type protease/lipase transport system fused ATPase/permease subunit
VTQDGYRTLIGSGTGHPLTRQVALQLGLARALLRKPRLLLLDDGDLFAEAVGDDRVKDILQNLADSGVAVLVGALSNLRFKWITRVVELRGGRFWPR